jgi:hypothetical protein
MRITVFSEGEVVGMFRVSGTTETDSFKAWVIRFLELPVNFKLHLMASDCIAELRNGGYRVVVKQS